MDIAKYLPPLLASQLGGMAGDRDPPPASAMHQQRRHLLGGRAGAVSWCDAAGAFAGSEAGDGAHPQGAAWSDILPTPRRLAFMGVSGGLPWIAGGAVVGAMDGTQKGLGIGGGSG